MKRARTLAVVVLALLLSTATRITFAAQADGFVKMAPGQQETISAPPMVLAAYAFVWAAVFVYVFLLWQRLSRVERELADVNAKLAARPRA